MRTLFFFPHAGGSAKSYASFKRFLPKDLNVVTMELSGRFTRSSEPLLHSIKECIHDLFATQKELPTLLRGGDYAVFGHSMGTVLATEFVRQVRKRDYPAPLHVFLSGKTAPDEDLHCFPDIDAVANEDILAFFAKHSMTSAPPIQDEKLMQQIGRILCNDVRMAEHYSVAPKDAQFGCDITVLYGTDDDMLKGADMHGWGRFTDKSCVYAPFSGGHFYYTQHKEEVCNLITRTLGMAV